MPKIVSRSAVSTSTDATPTESSAAALRTFYCLCGEFVLVIDKNLRQLPRRTTDGAYIVRAKDTPSGKARVFKLNANQSKPIYIKRNDGLERQCRFHCTRCTLPIGYQTVPGSANAGPYLYLKYGALTQQQGHVPSEAFEGENEAYLESMADEEQPRLV